MDISELFKYGWIAISGVFVWLFKSLDSQWKSKIERLEKENETQDRKISKLELDVVRLESKKVTREDLDNLMATHFSHFEKALASQKEHIDKRFEDIKESITARQFVDRSRSSRDDQ